MSPDRSRPQDPYAPPAALAPAREPIPGSVRRMGPRVLAWSLVLGPAYGLLAGSIVNLQFSVGLRAFGGVEYVPRAIALSALRSWGPWGSMLVPAMTATVLLHRQGKRGDEAFDARMPLFAGAAVPLLYPVVVATGFFASLLIWVTAFAGTVHVFLDAAHDVVLLMDVAFGACVSVLEAIAVAIGLRVAGPALRSPRWHAFWKLLFVFVVLRGVSFGAGYLGRWFG